MAETNSNSVQQNNPAGQANDPIDQFLGQILDDKKITIDTPEVRQQLISDLRNHLMNQIDRAMINALNEEQLRQLNDLLDKEGVQDNEIQDFFRQSGINGEQVALNTMMRFRQYYLGNTA